MKRNDKWLLIVVAVVIVLLFVGLWLGQSSGSYITVYQDGKPIGTYSIFGDECIQVETEDAHFNTIVIEAGKVRVSEADCPDGLCVSQQAVSKGGESIICLPHKLVIAVHSDTRTQLDAVVQ